MIERLAGRSGADKIVMGDLEFEKVTTPEPDQQTTSIIAKCACRQIPEI